MAVGLAEMVLRRCSTMASPQVIHPAVGYISETEELASHLSSSFEARRTVVWQRDGQSWVIAIGRGHSKRERERERDREVERERERVEEKESSWVREGESRKEAELGINSPKSSPVKMASFRG